MSFSFEIYEDHQDQIVQLIGVIDERAVFSEIPALKGMRLILDLRGVKLMNSVGLRSWVMWTRNLQRAEGIFLRNCPPIVVHQINILEGFLPLDATVESFEVPYFCENCGNENRFLALRGKDFVEAHLDKKEEIRLPDSIHCEKCRSNCETDIIPAKYLKFLRRRVSG